MSFNASSTTSSQIGELSSCFYLISHNVWGCQKYYRAYSYKLIFNFSSYNVTNCIFAPDAITDIQVLSSALFFLDLGVPYSLIFPTYGISYTQWNSEIKAQTFPSIAVCQMHRIVWNSGCTQSAGYAQNPTPYYHGIFMRLRGGCVCYPDVARCLSACTCLLLKALNLQFLEGFFACSLSLYILWASPRGLALVHLLCYIPWERACFLQLSHPSVLFTSTFPAPCCWVTICSLHWDSRTLSIWCLPDWWLCIRTNMTDNE